MEAFAVVSKDGAATDDDVPRCMKIDERAPRSASLSNHCRRWKQRVSLVP